MPKNILKMLETANNEPIPYSKESLGTDPVVFEAIAKRCGFESILIGDHKDTFIKLKKRGIPIVMLYDKSESNQISCLDIADIHAGHKDFSPQLLDKTLAEYYRGGYPLVDYVFIAGDLFEGVFDERYETEIENDKTRNKTIEKLEHIREYQVNQLFEVLSKYDFDYRAISGNHDFTFELFGLESPIALLERKMQERHLKFMFYDTYIVDFIMAGITKRVMHLERYNEQVGGGHNACDRIERFARHGGLTPYYHEKQYPVRLFQCGHIHKKMECYDSKNKIFITQSGSFIAGQCDDSVKPAIWVKGRVTEDNLILRT